MATRSTLLCIHRDPAQLTSLQEKGYELVTATNGHDGLRLFMTQHVDAIVLEYHLGLLDGSIVAAEIKKIRPSLPIVMLADHLDLPDDDLKSIDALVTKSDGDRLLLATIHFVLHVKPGQKIGRSLRTQPPSHLRPPGSSRRAEGCAEVISHPTAIEGRDERFSPTVWRSIRDGIIHF
jgi:DNA-binding response OmpR family regulator